MVCSPVIYPFNLCLQFLSTCPLSRLTIIEQTAVVYKRDIGTLNKDERTRNADDMCATVPLSVTENERTNRVIYNPGIVR